ncbi:MAG: DUF4347 domain-containing protein [Cyanobacteria bacterium P01_A01_bin.114]
MIAYGVPGCLFLGNSELSLDTLQQYHAQIQTWFGQTRVAEPSLLLYGCNVAFGDAGEELITKLHHLTRANVAAAYPSPRVKLQGETVSALGHC